ncbi:MAG TPA: hypothetical protein DCQ98_00440 [Planctomycetaceae bacterium]|nr:hypothetical protein [Planctomycetaceae bacterium]
MIGQTGKSVPEFGNLSRRGERIFRASASVRFAKGPGQFRRDSSTQRERMTAVRRRGMTRARRIAHGQGQSGS